MSFILNGDALPAARADKNPIPYGADPTRYADAAFVNALRNAAIDTQAFLRGGLKLFKADGTNPVDVLVVAGVPVVSAAKGALAVDATTPNLYQNQDGGTTWKAVGGGSGSIAIASETAGDFDFATLGAVDWVFPEAWGAARNIWHSKAAGGWLLDSFEFLNPQSASAIDTRSWLNHAASADDTNINGLHNVGDTIGVTKNMNGYTASGTGALYSGFRFRIPCSPTPRTIRWQGTGFNAQTLVSAKLSIAGLATAQTLAFNTSGASGMDYRAAVTFSGPVGAELVITHAITTCIGGNQAHLYVGAIGCA